MPEQEHDCLNQSIPLIEVKSQPSEGLFKCSRAWKFSKDESLLKISAMSLLI